MPHNLTAGDFLQELKGFQTEFKKLYKEARDSIASERVLDEEKKQAYRDHIASL